MFKRHRPPRELATHGPWTKTTTIIDNVLAWQRGHFHPSSWRTTEICATSRRIGLLLTPDIMGTTCEGHSVVRRSCYRHEPDTTALPISSGHNAGVAQVCLRQQQQLIGIHVPHPAVTNLPYGTAATCTFILKYKVLRGEMAHFDILLNLVLAIAMAFVFGR